jgi:hypothetical protein
MVGAREPVHGQKDVDMFGFHCFSRGFGAGAAALAITFAPLAALAQDDVPSYARPAVVSTDETIHGRIRSVDGAFILSVDDDRGFIDSVQLHQGTIINPTGLTLSPGMSVTVVGFNAGDAFDANEIDTPYTYDGPLPTPVYYGPGYWCPGFAYGYGPSFSLAIIIGGGGPWYYEHRPFYGRPWDGRRYFGAEIARAGGPRFAEPHVRLEQRGTAEAPGAFTGRSFAGNPAPSSRRYEESRGQTPRDSTYERGVQAERAPVYGRAPSNQRSFESGRGGGYARGGGAARTGGGGSHGGRGH